MKILFLGNNKKSKEDTGNIFFVGLIFLFGILGFICITAKLGSNTYEQAINELKAEEINYEIN